MRFRPAFVTAALVVLPALAAVSYKVALFESRTHCDVLAREVKADGRWHTIARLWQRHGPGVSPDDVLPSGVEGRVVRMRAGIPGSVEVLYRAPLNGGDARLKLRYRAQNWILPLHASVDWSDSFGDGLPDALRLHDADDRLRLRRWFTALADRAAALPDKDLPPEITDCSALLRYSYRLALTRHDDRWYKQFPPGVMTTLPSVEQWNYPETPLGAALFRVTPPTQTPQPADFAQFADAKTLYSRNSFRIGRDVRLAQPGDLLFFHQLEQDSQYHSMIVTGDGGAWVVYHTGPVGTGAARTRGEMRRARMADLLQHPDPRWHPTADNPNFLGVYRWDLLRED